MQKKHNGKAALKFNNKTERNRNDFETDVGPKKKNKTKSFSLIDFTKFYLK